MRSLYSFLTAALWALALASPALAQQPAAGVQPAPAAYATIEQSTNRVMNLVNRAQNYADAEPERYYRELQTILDDVVDFGGFARAVMGPYASGKRYRSLDAAGKKQLREQVGRFTDVMRRGLVQTYGKGLIAFGGSQTKIQKTGKDITGKNTMSITELIYGDAAEPYVINYQMARGRNGQWKIRNLIVESINLGAIYRNQFQAAAKDYQGDIDAVIDNWNLSDAADGLGG